MWRRWRTHAGVRRFERPRGARSGTKFRAPQSASDPAVGLAGGRKGTDFRAPRSDPASERSGLPTRPGAPSTARWRKPPGLRCPRRRRRCLDGRGRRRDIGRWSGPKQPDPSDELTRPSHSLTLEDVFPRTLLASVLLLGGCVSEAARDVDASIETACVELGQGWADFASTHRACTIDSECVLYGEPGDCNCGWGLTPKAINRAALAEAERRFPLEEARACVVASRVYGVGLGDLCDSYTIGPNCSLGNCTVYPYGDAWGLCSIGRVDSGLDPPPDGGSTPGTPDAAPDAVITDGGGPNETTDAGSDAADAAPRAC